MGSRNLGVLLLLLVLNCNKGLGHATKNKNKDIYHVELPNDQEVEDAHGNNNTMNKWAVLVAGSNGYYNYRHQADVCHAYQILIRNGVPHDNIIVLMFDDIAYSPENPTQGVIINHPDGPNVYAGVKIDYKGEDVKPEVFLNVLKGDEDALRGVGTGRVLKSGPTDHVFINFVDHGAPGLVAFPSSELYAKDLLKTLKTMHQRKMFAKLVFYLEACESGSMFKDLLPAHWNIFATTAANDRESSYACYLDDLRKTYLGDVYSVMWMENSDQVDLEKETLQKQFLIVKNETNTSHVMEYGDSSLRHSPVADFLGENEPEKKVPLPKAELNAIDSSEAARAILERQYTLSSSPEEKKDLKWRLKRFDKLRKIVRTEMKEIIAKVTKGDARDDELLVKSRLSITNWDCYETVAKYYSKHCFSIAKNPFVTRQLYILVNMCERGWVTESITKAMSVACKNPSLEGIY